jgi:cell division protein FtsB
MSPLDDLKARLRSGLELQNACTARWHDPAAIIETGDSQDLHTCIAAQHACNFHLWHIEDTARRRDVGPEVIADCKRRIDALNQARNDGMEKVDACLLRELAPLLPPLKPGIAPRRNTESLGMAIDRMSILSLKIWHMEEQLARAYVDADHIQSCADKASVLRAQRRDLESAVLDLVDEFAAGNKQPHVYFQFKMYNDPSLNPELYGNREQPHA